MRSSQLPSNRSLWSCGHMMSRDKIKLHLHLHKAYKHQTWHTSDSFWSCGHVMSLEVIKTYLHFRKTRKHQFWHIGDLWWGTPTHKVIWPLIMSSHVVMWQITNNLLPTFKVLVRHFSLQVNENIIVIKNRVI